MAGILLGILVGALIGILAGVVIYGVIDTLSTLYAADFKIFLIAMVIAIVAGSLIGFNIDKHSEHAYVEQYLVQKKTIEDFILRKTATDIEKMELANTAVVLNKGLAEKKYSADKWYGFAIDKKVLEMEYIRVSEQ